MATDAALVKFSYQNNRNKHNPRLSWTFHRTAMRRGCTAVRERLAPFVHRAELTSVRG